MEFIDRIDEKKRLLAFLDSPEGGLACVYGRRRIGKSRLLAEILRDRADAVFYIADRSDMALQRDRFARDIARGLPGFADVRYPDWGTLFDRWQRDAPAGSVLVIDELPYLVEAAPELPSVLQRIADGLRTAGRKIIICGSSQRMMQGLVLDENEPLYGRAREIIRLTPLTFPWLARVFPELSPFARFERYAVWGGVPRYWEICEGENDLWPALRRLVFSPQGIFHDEPQHILQDDLRDAVQAASVLTLIGQGVSRMSEIASRLEVAATALGRPLKRLGELGLIRRDMPFGCDEKSNKRVLYRIDDHFLRFWYTFAQPNYSDAYFLSTPGEITAIRPAFRTFLGETWERLVRETLARRPLPGVPGRWRQPARWWGHGLNRRPMEIDVVAESPDGRTLLVGEAKLALTPAEAEHELRELTAKAAQLPFAARYEKTLCRLFVAEGGVEGAVGLEWCGEDG